MISKNKFIILFITFLVVCSSFSYIFATDETIEEVIVDESSTDVVDDTVTDVVEPDIYSSDLFLSGEDIVVDTIVDGNLVIIANNVTINTQIGGDVIIIANNINIAENGYIYSSLFSISKTLTITGVACDVYACSNDILISGYIYRDITLAANTVNILGVIGRNASITSNSILFQNDDVTLTGAIYGNLDYHSDNSLAFPENTITGETLFYSTNSSNISSIIGHIISCLTLIISTIAIYLITLALKPSMIINSNKLYTKNFFKFLGLGIISVILLPILAVLLYLLIATRPLAIILMLIYLLLIILSIFVFILTINNLLCLKLNITKNIGKLLLLILITLVLYLLTLIPYIVFIILPISIILGSGQILSNLIFKLKSRLNFYKKLNP